VAALSIYRERFACTLAHQPVDRCPIDLGGTPQSTMEDPRSILALAEHLGLSGAPPVDYEKFDTRILEHFDIDFRRVGNLISYATGREGAISATERVDAYGIRYRYSGMYWDIAAPPLAGAGMDDIAAYTFPSVAQMRDDLDLYAAQAKRLHDDSPYVVVGEHPVFGVLELACWLCGYDHIMMMMALEPEFIHLLFGKILDFQRAILREYYGRLGPFLHLTTSGDDFGTQKGLFMSPDMWRAFVKPYLRERIIYTRQFTDAVYMHHSCGAVFDIIPDLIEIGVGILNPIQPHAAGMDPVRLKATYGNHIVFHGGLDTQEVLPSNNAAEIATAVEHLVTCMAPRSTGGYIFAPAHNLQADVSSQAIAAMYGAVRQRF